jgi:hypothetical protein
VIECVGDGLTDIGTVIDDKHADGWAFIALPI